MVCRERSIGSAITSYVMQTTTLEEQQVLSLYHEVMREGRTATDPTTTQRMASIREIVTSVNAADLSDARRRSLLGRLERANDEPMDGQRYYATTRLAERAVLAEQALNGYVQAAARDLGISETEVRGRMAASREIAAQNRSETVSREWLAERRADPNTSRLPLDRQTAVAVHAIEAQRAAARAATPARRSVSRTAVQGSSSVSEMGYDPETGRCEVVLRSNPDRAYAYQMSPQEYANFASGNGYGGSVGRYYAYQIRGNDAYRFGSAAESEASEYRHRCATCGEFAAASHSCPTRDSAEERNATMRRARRAARARTTTASTGATATPAAPAEPTRLAGRERLYHGASGSLQTVPLGDALAAARRDDAVSVPLSLRVINVSTADGTQFTRGNVSGRATITYNGRGRGYTASAVTSPGDSGQDRLRCNCADYQRNYDCVHVRQAVQDLNTRINQDRLRDRHGIGPAVDQVNAELAQDRAESIAAQGDSRLGWADQPTVSYVEDHAAFQEAYKAAKDRQAAGEDAVPYMTENATGGLGSRDGGRAFGVELEFDISPNVDRYTALANIGRDLHAAGLTSSARQGYYHSSMGRGYTENHQGGWSFEQDCTVSGEIVSPIMYDEPETWENLQKVCDIVKRHGGVMTVRTGSHVHVSAHNYNHTVANHNRLLGAFAENEDTLYRLSSNPERGTHRGPEWCAPNRVPANGYTNVSSAQASNMSHGLGLNMQSVSGRQSDHVEFRTFDGTMSPALIQTQIKMALGITESAFRDQDYTPGAHTPLGSTRQRNRAEHGASRRLTGEAWRQDTLPFRTFADRIFRRPEDKAQLAALFAVTKWQRRGR